jgi:hypothetical protein
MDDMLTLTEVPLVGDHPTVLDNQVHAGILMRCFVSSAEKKDTMLIIAGIETFQEIGEGSRGDGSMAMAMIFSQIFICILDS